MTTCTHPWRPRLCTWLPRLELATELTRIELGYAAAMAMEIEHLRPDLVRERAIVAVRMARARQAAALADLALYFAHGPLTCGDNRGGIPARAVDQPKHAQVRETGLADAYDGQPIVYLLHFDRLYVPYPGAPLRDCAGHYTGWTENLAARLARHAAGGGARLLAIVHQADISWQLARVWPGPRERERQLKRQGGASRRCPLCKVPTASGQNATRTVQL